jgi:hypothetical protein
MTDQISFKSFKLEDNRVVLASQSMIPLDSVSFISYGVHQNPYKTPLLIVGIIVVIVGFFIGSDRYTSALHVIPVIGFGALLILAAFYKSAQYQIVSSSGRELSINASSDVGEQREFIKFSYQVLDAKEKYIKS